MEGEGGIPGRSKTHGSHCFYGIPLDRGCGPQDMEILLTIMDAPAWISTNPKPMVSHMEFHGFGQRSRGARTLAEP